MFVVNYNLDEDYRQLVDSTAYASSGDFVTYSRTIVYRRDSVKKCGPLFVVVHSESIEGLWGETVPTLHTIVRECKTRCEMKRVYADFVASPF